MSIQSLTANIEFAQNLGHVAQSYASLAASKLSRIRGKIESTRTFFGEVAALYHAVREVGAKKYHLSQEGNGKTASVLLTSNQRFYGSTNTAAAEHFFKNFAGSDLFVVGKVGHELVDKPHTSFIFQNDIPTNEEISKLIESLSSYTQILVVHPQSKSILEVVPQVVDVTASINNTTPSLSSRTVGERSRDFSLSLEMTSEPTKQAGAQPNGAPRAVFDFIFEPEIKKMIEFFKDQATTLLIGQAFLEAELAREAARLLAMDTSRQRAKEYVQTQESALRNLKNIFANKHLLEGFLGVVEE
ncbi:MAG: F0F1 ATP synthase subunit gamma [Candidatus Blackburnbacteria bacterium]|nr:F0F1 ATP synthase subunit gamma [Candidatus Blackburnbacteria bacterium]